MSPKIIPFKLMRRSSRYECLQLVIRPMQCIHKSVTSPNHPTPHNECRIPNETNLNVEASNLPFRNSQNDH